MIIEPDAPFLVELMSHAHPGECLGLAQMHCISGFGSNRSPIEPGRHWLVLGTLMFDRATLERLHVSAGGLNGILGLELDLPFLPPMRIVGHTGTYIVSGKIGGCAEARLIPVGLGLDYRCEWCEKDTECFIELKPEHCRVEPCSKCGTKTWHWPRLVAHPAPEATP